MDSTDKQQDLRTKMEKELNILKRNFEDETAAPQNQIRNLKQKHTIDTEKLNEQLDSVQKAKIDLEKTKHNLERASLQEQVFEEVEARKNLEKKLDIAEIQIAEYKKKAEEEADASALLKEQTKTMSKDIDILHHKLDELQEIHEKLKKSKNKLQSKFEDLNIELDYQIEELEAYLQLTDDSKLRLEVNMQDLKTHLEKDRGSRWLP